MTTVSDLWFLADEASQRAERVAHRLSDEYDDYLEPTRSRRVSRRRFRTLAERIARTGSPYGAHTAVHDGDRLLLVRHEGVDRWVLPGGGIERGETSREAAERELTEEAGVDVDYRGLAVAFRFEIRHGEHDTWGVMPVFAARARETATAIADPDEEISAAEWFRTDALPRDTRDRDVLRRWAERAIQPDVSPDVGDDVDPSLAADSG